MSLFFKIPHQNKFDSPVVMFTANFNNPTLGVYDFNVAANQNVNLFQMERNSIYLIERQAIGGNISQEIYLNSINTIPLLTLRDSINRGNVFTREIPIVNYYNDRQATVFVHSDKDGDFITCSLSGILNQVAETVGKITISLFVTFSVYQIALKDFNIAFRENTNNELNLRR